jgi:hypothetical protein
VECGCGACQASEGYGQIVARKAQPTLYVVLRAREGRRNLLGGTARRPRDGWAPLLASAERRKICGLQGLEAPVRRLLMSELKLRPGERVRRTQQDQRHGGTRRPRVSDGETWGARSDPRGLSDEVAGLGEELVVLAFCAEGGGQDYV